MKKKLSIIIPVYNVENYLNRCVDSIVDDNYLNDYEILLIDDGSTDRSGEICDSYSVCPLINVYHKINGGLSDARNYGLKKAKGEYIWFIDSDDFIDDGSIGKVLNVIDENSSDVLVIQSKIIDDNGIVTDEKKYSIKEKKYSINDYLDEMYKNDESIILCAPYHIINRKIIDDNNIYFKKGIIHEDELWTPQILLNVNDVYYSSLKIYYHYMRSDSIMHSSSNKRSGESILYITKELFNLYATENKRRVRYLSDRAVNNYLLAVKKLEGINFEKISGRVVFANSFYFKTKMKALLYYLSPKLYKKIYNMFK